jgi:hypothetical protein
VRPVDEEFLTRVDAVEPLTSVVGLAAQAGGELAYNCHVLYWSLTNGGERVAYRRNKQPSVWTLLKWCTEALPGRALPDELDEAARDALTAARAANQRRNDLVHGVWLPPESGDVMQNHQERWSGPVMNGFTLDEARAVVAQLARANLRLMGLRAWLYLKQHPTARDHDGAMTASECLAQLRGEFDMFGLHEWRLHSERWRGPVCS